MTEPDALTAVINWYRAIPDRRGLGASITVPRFTWGATATSPVQGNGSYDTARYVGRDYRLEAPTGLADWIH